MLASHFLWKQFYNNGAHLLKLADFFKISAAVDNYFAQPCVLDIVKICNGKNSLSHL